MTFVAYILIGCGGLLSLMNWGTLIVSLRSKRFVSAIPLLGALSLGGGLALLPATRLFASLALIADYGTLILIIAVPRIAYEAWSTSRINLLWCFTSTTKGRIIAVKFYRRHVAVISARFDPPIPCDDHGSRVASFGLAGKWSAAQTGFVIAGYGVDRQLVITKENGMYVTAELNYPKDREYKYDCLDGLIMQKLD